MALKNHSLFVILIRLSYILCVYKSLLMTKNGFLMVPPKMSDYMLIGCRLDFLKVQNPYRWLPDVDSDKHDKKTGTTEPRKTTVEPRKSIAEPRRNLLKSDVRNR